MKGPLAYIGGKSRLASQIIEMIPEHKSYIEVFAGGAWVFFKKEPSKYEVINDLDSELISFYRVVQNHLEEFLKQFKWLLASREMWEDWNSQLKADGLTDIQKAARYYYVQRMSFGGKIKGRTFGTNPEGNPRINLVRLEEEMSAVHLRLIQVMIENLSWEKIIDKYDKPKTFFFIDPPYHSKPCYKHNFDSIDDYTTMADRLKSVKGKFLLTLNDHEEIREAFKDFNTLSTSVMYSVKKDENIEAKELIISNYMK